MNRNSSIATIGAIAALILIGVVVVALQLARPAAPPPGPTAPIVLPSATATAPAAATSIAPAATLPQGTLPPGALVRVWSSMCVEGVPYTLLSVPLDAKFALVQAQANLPPTLIPITGITATPISVPTYSTPSFVGGTAAPFPTDTPTLEAINGTPISPSSNNGTLGIAPQQNSCKGLGEMNGLQLFMCTGPEGNPFAVYARNANGAQLYEGTLWDCTVPIASPTVRVTPTVGKLPPPTSPAATTVPPTVQPTLPPPTAQPTVSDTPVPPATATP